jgi:hypothetical protein
MALAPYIGKAALSATEILAGVSPQLFQEMLATVCIGVAVDEAVEQTFECQVLSEMLVNLLARMYPRLLILAPVSHANSLKTLAASINPNIELLDQGAPNIWVHVGGRNSGTSDRNVIYASSDGWIARILERPVACGKTNNPIGAAAAACLAAANVFRAVFSRQLSGSGPDRDLSLCLFDYKVNDPSCERCDSAIEGAIVEHATLVGAGAIGNGVLWALARSPIGGVLNVIDPESIDETNPQRYVLTDCATRIAKVELAANILQTASIKAAPFKGTWTEFVQSGTPFSLVAAAVDTVEARVEIQASLPRHVLNAWTQSGDLGISRHAFLGDQACLACLYIPPYAHPSEDLLVQQAIRYSGDIMAVRNLLYTNEPLDMNWIERIANDMTVDRSLVLPFLGRPLRELYQKGICGGILLPVSSEGTKTAVTVPMAFQSAMAGIMLAAEIILFSTGKSSAPPPVTTKINLLRPLGHLLSEPESKHSRGRCICQDPDFIDAYRSKFNC